jgi:hypothetical protein
MKRFILTGLSVVLMSSTIMPAVKAQTQVEKLTTYNSVVTNKALTSHLTPFEIASLAYQGSFRSQGIPGYANLLSAHQSGKITAEKIVQIAVNANLIPQSILTDKGYINSVEEQLRDLSTAL